MISHDEAVVFVTNHYQWRTVTDTSQTPHRVLNHGLRTGQWQKLLGILCAGFRPQTTSRTTAQYDGYQQNSPSCLASGQGLWNLWSRRDAVPCGARSLPASVLQIFAIAGFTCDLCFEPDVFHDCPLASDSFRDSLCVYCVILVMCVMYDCFSETIRRYQPGLVQDE